MHANGSDEQFLVAARYWGAGLWLTSLTMATIVVGGLSAKTNLLVLVGVGSFLLGTFWSPRSAPAGVVAESSASRGRPTSAMLFLFVVVVLQCGLAYRAISSLSDLGAEFRESYYEGDVQGGSVLFVLYESFLVPLGVYAVAHWLTRRTSIGLWVLATSSFFCLDALLKAGRFPLYFLFFFLALSRALGVTKIRLWVYGAVATVLMLGALLIALARQGMSVNSEWSVITELFTVGVMNYHIVGFYIFEQISNNATFIDALGAGAYTFGFFSYVTALISRRAGFELHYPQQDLNIALTQDSYVPGLGTYNAFGTNLLPLYVDAGFIGIVIGFYSLGWLVRGGLRRQSGVGAIDVIALFVMIFGLFQPLIMGAYLWVPLVFDSLRKVSTRMVLPGKAG